MRSVFLILVMTLAVFSGGCGNAKFVFSGGPNKHTIEVNAPDGAYGESYDFRIGKDRNTVIRADLSGGSLQINFAQVTVFDSDTNHSEDIIVGDVIESVTVSGTDEVTLSLPKDDYIMQVTARGSLSGPIRIEIVRK